MSTLKVTNIESPTGGGVNAKIADINGGQLSNRNLIHNGAMNVAQRGTSGTANGFNCIDRFGRDVNGGTGTFTDTQQTLTSGSPYDEGFRKFYRTASSSASTAASGSYLQVRYKAEAQDIANSGWDYTDSSSFVTLSFWVRASVTQTYGIGVQTHDGTSYAYNKNFALTADTWTKIKQKIPGNSNLQFDNDANKGLTIKFWPHLGSTYNGATDDTWNTQASNNLGSNIGTSWWTASSATFDLTGVQLEVGDVATAFEHRSYADELQRCLRYTYVLGSQNVTDNFERFDTGICSSSTKTRIFIKHPVVMRTAPTVSTPDASQFQVSDTLNGYDASALSRMSSVNGPLQTSIEVTHGSGTTAGNPYIFERNDSTSGRITFDAEL